MRGRRHTASHDELVLKWIKVEKMKWRDRSQICRRELDGGKEDGNGAGDICRRGRAGAGDWNHALVW